MKTSTTGRGSNIVSIESEAKAKEIHIHALTQLPSVPGKAKTVLV